METIKSITNIKNIDRSVVTIGNFDGLHKGHQVLIKKAVNYAKEKHIKSIVFTFENHPANFFNNNCIENIITNNEKKKRIEILGIDIVVSIPFDEYMTQISAEEFVKYILVEKLHAEKIVVGHDFTFARNKEGNVDVLERLANKYSIDIEIVNPVKLDDIRVSSSYIRRLVKCGKVSDVKKYLGHNYEIEGKVIKARQLGRTIGFPTANLEIKDNLILPKRGIYASKVYIDDKIYFGATNIGYNPTVQGNKLSIETHILEFDEDIYGKNIKVELLMRIRDEKKFESLDALKNQLQKDTKYVYEKYICKN